MDKTFMMPFGRPLVRWDFGRREKRFFIYGGLEGQVAHCANTGSMLGLLDAKGVWVTPFDADSGRKLLFGAEMLEMADGTLVGINTQRPNHLAEGAILAGMVPELGYRPLAIGDRKEIRREVKLDAKTRFDLKVGETWVEVKNVTLVRESKGERVDKIERIGEKAALFPDSVTERGAKHLRELEKIVREGGSALQVFVVQRGDATSFGLAEEIDATYAAALRSAMAAGVKVVALGCTLTPEGIHVDRRLPVVV